MKIDVDIIGCIVLPVVGYYTMVAMKKKARKAIEMKVFAEGIYRFKPVYGDSVLPIAKGYERAGLIIFIFMSVLPVAVTLLNHLF